MEDRDRRAVLADAAIELVAAQGIRALTHRAVDTWAEMPPGTTSAYFRTRKALLTGLVRRMAALDRADSERHATGRPLASGRREVDRLADDTAELIDRWLGTARSRVLARYACSIEAVHHPELRDLLAPHGDAARASVSAFLARSGVSDPDRRARDYVACVDGLILHRLLGMGAPPAPPPGTPESVAELRACVLSLLRAVTDMAPGP